MVLGLPLHTHTVRQGQAYGGLPISGVQAGPLTGQPPGFQIQDCFVHVAQAGSDRPGWVCVTADQT